MAQRKIIEIFSAGCHVCREAEAIVRRIAGADHDVRVRDMHQPHVVRLAIRHEIASVPAVVIDGQLSSCCAGVAVDEAVLRESLMERRSRLNDILGC